MASTGAHDRFWIDVDRWLRGPDPRTLLMTARMDARDPSVLDELSSADGSLAFFVDLNQS
ncbi:MULTISPECIES: hypothetical protein [Micromonospora]|uniref:Uncharacterized protein n=1 Tax=Micromonospora maris TaxID=1003110 RepID=A0A9X0HZP4_9ACTN|nr:MULTISPECIES: hypothetical protein [Micromonospora]AEB44569.1 hypothetical protein VAB18032_17335 [Micromonospora maris AB-18-032]KUJ44074.1 hypothetical protein ADL17_12590 [Micromonospora maris]RUL89835.1 hypothetical protein EG812_28690 [Verrucosispora sp. FIM060022]